MSLDKKILERIEKENIWIRPVWFFDLKNLFFGLGTILFSVCGSLSLALLFEVMRRQGKISYVWVILFGLFLFGGWWLVTKIDYLRRIRLVPILSILFFVSLSFGYVTFVSGTARKITRELKDVPIYAVMLPVNDEISKENNIKYEYSEKRKYFEDKKRQSTEGDFPINEHGHSHHSHHFDRKRKNNEVNFENKSEDDGLKIQDKKQGIKGEEGMQRRDVKGVSREIKKTDIITESQKVEDIKDEQDDFDNKTVSSEDEDDEELEMKEED